MVRRAKVVKPPTHHMSKRIKKARSAQDASTKTYQGIVDPRRKTSRQHIKV